MSWFLNSAKSKIRLFHGFTYSMWRSVRNKPYGCRTQIFGFWWIRIERTTRNGMVRGLPFPSRLCSSLYFKFRRFFTEHPVCMECSSTNLRIARGHIKTVEACNLRKTRLKRWKSEETSSATSRRNSYGEKGNLQRLQPILNKNKSLSINQLFSRILFSCGRPERSQIRAAENSWRWWEKIKTARTIECHNDIGTIYIQWTMVVTRFENIDGEKFNLRYDARGYGWKHRVGSFSSKCEFWTMNHSSIWKRNPKLSMLTETDKLRVPF